ncbi:MAG TPA: type II and III secretion system protein [Bryobacteraceae bacterium]|nr:type II and III secretion system protein [Bryobacteraceae bacterium]
MRRSPSTRGVLAILCVGTTLFGSSGQEDSPKEQAAALAKKAKKAAKASKEADAYLLYSEAAAMEPRNKRLKQKMEALQSRAALQSSPVPAAGFADPSALPLAPPLAPQDVFASSTAAEFARARQPQGPPKLKPKPGTQDFDLNGNARALFDQVAQRFGLETVYDGDYPTGGPQFRFRINGIDYRQALHDLEAMTNSFVAPLSPRVFIVAQDTPAKRNDLEQFVAVVVPVPEAMTVQELTEIGQAVKQATNIDKITWDTADGVLIMRDRLSRVLPAQALLEQLFAWRPEVGVEVEFLEVSDSDIQNYGFNLTNSVPAVFLGQVLNNVLTAPTGVSALWSFGSGKTLIGLGVAEVDALFNQSLSSTHTLFRAQARSLDSQAVTFHVGEKYPVITQGYFGGTTTQQGTTFQPPPSFTFEDLGVELKVTPHVHGVDGVTLAVETKFELLTGSAVNGIPIIGQRQVTDQVRLKNDEWAVVAGVMSSTDSKSETGFWGLAQLPVIGRLFKQVAKDKEHEDLLIAIRPHLLSLPPDQVVTRRVRVGSDTRPFTPL